MVQMSKKMERIKDVFVHKIWRALNILLKLNSGMYVFVLLPQKEKYISTS